MTPSIELGACSRRFWPWLILALWPVALALANPKWMYNGPITDPYIYLGAFLRLPAQLKYWGDLYFYSRLAFLLPGYLAYQGLPPQVANALLDFGYFYGSILTLFVLLKQQLDLRTALFTALIIGGYSHFLQSIGWDYVDGAGAMYLLLALWAMSRSLTSSRTWLWLILVGLALGAGLHTHIFTAALWPALGLYMLLRWPAAWRWRRWLAVGVLIAAGIVVITGLLGLASLALGGPFTFFISTISFLQYYSSLSTNPWLTAPLVALLPTASWLMPPAVVLLAALGRGWQARTHFGDWARSQSGALIVVYVAAAASMILISTRPNSPVLNTGSYVGYLIPFMAVALAALAAPLLARLSVLQWRALLGVVLVSLPGSIVIGGWLAGGLASLVTKASGWVMLGGLAAALGLVAIRRGDFASLVGAVLAFALVNPFGPGAKTALLIPDAAARRETYMKVVENVRSIDVAWPGRQVWLWFNDQEDEAYGLTACALAACDRNVISRNFPVLRMPRGDTSSVPLLVPGRQVVLLSQQPDALALVASTTAGQVAAPLSQFSRANAAGRPAFNLHFLQEPEQGWQISLPPADWMSFQPTAAAAQADGSIIADPAVSQPGFMAYGPYIHLPPGHYEATFWLSAAVTAAVGGVAQLDISVAVNPVDFVGSRRALQMADFSGDESAQPFSLTFANGNPSNALEFRVQTFAKTRLTLSRVQLKWLDGSPVGVQAAH